MENPAHVSTTGFQMSVEGSHNQTDYGCARGKSHGPSPLSVEPSLSKNTENCERLSAVKSDYKYKDLLSQDGDQLAAIQDIVICNTNNNILDGESTDLPFESLSQPLDISTETTVSGRSMEEKQSCVECDSPNIECKISDKHFIKDLDQSVKSVVLEALSTVPVICVGGTVTSSTVVTPSLPLVTVQLQNVKNEDSIKVAENIASNALNLEVDELLRSNAFQVDMPHEAGCAVKEHCNNENDCSSSISAVCTTGADKIPVSTVDLAAGFGNVAFSELGFISCSSLKDVCGLVSTKSTNDMDSLLTSVPTIGKEEDMKLLVETAPVPTSPGSTLISNVDPVLNISSIGAKCEKDIVKVKKENAEHFMNLCQNEKQKTKELGVQTEPSLEILTSDSNIVSDKTLIFEQQQQDSKLVDEAQLQCTENVEEMPIAPEIINNETVNGQADVATISFSTDKINQTMQILVNTSQGQQIFEMNTANTPLGSLAVSGSLSVDSCNIQSLLKGASVQPNSHIMNAVFMEKQQNESVQVTEENIVKHVENEIVIEEEEVEGAQFNSEAQNIAEFVNKLSSGRNKKKTWSCPVVGCNQVYDKECKLRVHLINHSENRAFKCYVDGCDWAFTTPYRLRRHLETHIGKKQYVCDVEGCNCQFTTIYNLNTHKIKHRRPNSIMCPAEGCGAGFPTRRKMELHLRIHKEIEAPYKCTICSKEYYSANAIASHLRIHQHNEDDFKCPFQGCGKIFDKICRLKQHVRCHTGDRPYICEVEDCGWRFITASKLARHMQKHTGERKFTCTEPGCGKSFMRPEHLKGHIIIHSGDKPFECPHENCPARFNAKSSLYVHLKKHNGIVNNSNVCNRPDGSSVVKLIYPCPVAPCNKKFQEMDSLKHHLENRHLSDLSVLEGQQICVPLVYTKEGQNVPSKISISVVNAGDSYVNMGSEEGVVITSDIASEGETSATRLVLNPDKPSSSASTGVFPTSIQTLSPSKVLSPSDLELLTSSRLLQENNSGSARTDFCSNHILSSRAKKWWMVQQQPKGMLSGEGTSHETGTMSQDSSQTGIVLRSSDVMLASSIPFSEQSAGEHFVQAHFLHDDPSSASNIYQEDNILAPVNSSFVSELSIPVSLLSDQSDGERLVIESINSASDFPPGSNEDVEFAEAAISLEGLE